MKYAAAIIAFAAVALAQDTAIPSPAISAPGYPLAGCAVSYSGSFGLQNVILPGTTKVKRTPPSEGTGHSIALTLNNGILYDQDSRFGYIASNEQFQFDNPIQAGGIYTEGWTLCPNNTLALGGTTVFYQCLSGDFYNIYYTPAGASCEPINLQILPQSASTGSSSVASSYVATSSAPVYTTSAAPSSYSVASSSSTVVVVTSSAAPASSTLITSAPTVAPVSATSTATSTTYTGAAYPVAVEGSFFAAAAGAAAWALL